MASAQSSSRRLGLLYHLSQTFNSSLDLTEVLNHVMDEVVKAINAERGFVMLLDEFNQLVFQVARGMDQQTIDDPTFQVSRTIAEQVARTGEAVLTSDAQTDMRFSMRQSVRILGLRSILCVPLIHKDRVLGVIYVDNRVQAGIFSESDLELLSAIALNAATAIENARLYQLAVEKGRMEQELKMAHDVQESFLPPELPSLEGWDFASRWQPARQVAGDYYDCIVFDDGRIGFLIADVSDKGMPAALFMALTRTTLRASLLRSTEPVEGITQANRLICKDSSGGMFVTLFYAELNPETGVVTYVNAGHNPPCHYRKQANKGKGGIFRLEKTGMALGVLFDAQYKQKRLILESGDGVLLYTDGLTDAINSRGEDFSMKRVEGFFTSNCQHSSEKALEVLDNELHYFCGGEVPFDDITLLWIKRE